ncbi:MAG: Fic family protein [bacterium]
MDYIIEKANFDSIDKLAVLAKLERYVNYFVKFVSDVSEPEYLYWDKVKYKQPPHGFTIEEAWFFIQLFRKFSYDTTPIRTEEGEYFNWMKLPSVDELLHKIDISTGGQIFSSAQIFSDIEKQKYISRGILEEAIASSQLEGAHTTRNVAKLMIANKREPKNISEQMILNNYKTISKIESNFKDRLLTKDLLLEMHRMLTYKTIPVEAIGRYRKDNDEIIVNGLIQNKEYVTFTPPNEDFLNGEMERFIEYANDVNEGKFLHPIIKAILLHFWIGYLHPFIDGNGRLARAIFYWYLLRKGYWTFMYIPISLTIKKAPVQYALAYIYSEQDNNDVTYFLDFHIRKIMQSLDDFNDYVTQKMKEGKEVDKVMDSNIKLTERQKSLIHYLIKANNSYITITSHSTLNNISRQTATKDLQKLIKSNLIKGEREGKYIKYSATPKLIKMANDK